MSKDVVVGEILNCLVPVLKDKIESVLLTNPKGSPVSTE